MSKWLMLLMTIGCLCAAKEGFAESETEPTIEEVLLAADDLFRKEHSIVTMEMTVKTARYERNGVSSKCLPARESEKACR